MQAAYGPAGLALGRTTWAQFNQEGLTEIEPASGRGSALSSEDFALLQPGD